MLPDLGKLRLSSVDRVVVQDLVDRLVANGLAPSSRLLRGEGDGRHRTVRPPGERDLSLRDYVLAGAREVAALEAELARLEQAMAEGEHDEPTLAAYGRAQESFELRGGRQWPL